MPHRTAIAVALAALLACSTQAADPCAKYYGRGYCTDYIRTKIGKKTPSGNAIAWPVSGKTPKVGTVAIFTFAWPFGHVAWVERVDSKNKTFTVSHWNFGATWVNKDCGVTNLFGKPTTTTFSFSELHLLGFYYPPK